MTLSIVYSRATVGITAPLVTVEVDISRGMPLLNIVGLPETAVKESKHRVRSALLNSCFEFPRRRITINLAPADLPKEGGRFDLPIALGILAASSQIPREKLAHYEFIGELALSGEIRAIHGILPVVLGNLSKKRNLIVPKSNAEEAVLVQEVKVFAAKHLLEVCAHLKGEQVLEPSKPTLSSSYEVYIPDLADVQGQLHAKRALAIAASGKHNLLFIGPPGTGKTMLATRLPGILPLLNNSQALEVATIASVSNNGFDPRQWRRIPFRTPHHTSSNVALVGGGRPPRPGEISLAHQGVLFLDELPEFNRQVLESLREPLESGAITISRAAFQTIFPAQFQLIAAMNPCPCGYYGSTNDTCRCSNLQIKRYLNKLSGPLLDRIDLQVHMPSLPSKLLSLIRNENQESSASIKEKIIQARQHQLNRQGKTNQELTVQELEHYCQLNPATTLLLNQAIDKFSLSARAYHRIIKIARTIADLSQLEKIDSQHVSEALSYRYLDKIKISDAHHQTQSYS